MENGSLSSYDLRGKHKKALEDLYPIFLKEFEPKQVVPSLLARRALLSSDMGLIYSQASREDRVKQFLSILQNKNSWWGPLIDSLIRTGNSGVAEKLIAASNSYANESAGQNSPQSTSST